MFNPRGTALPVATPRAEERDEQLPRDSRGIISALRAAAIQSANQPASARNVHLDAPRDLGAGGRDRGAAAAEGAGGRERGLSSRRARRPADGDGRAQGMRLAAPEAAASGRGPAEPPPGGGRRVPLVGAPERADDAVDLRRGQRSAIAC